MDSDPGGQFILGSDHMVTRRFLGPLKKIYFQIGTVVNDYKTPDPGSETATLLYIFFAEVCIE
jgi:hypothetical protein